LRAHTRVMSSVTSAAAAKDQRRLLVLSDMHLGSDIGDSPTAPPPARSESVDADLTELLRHYREAPADGAKWELVINGDFIDFIGISLETSRSSVSTELTAEERAHGLGTAEDHACIKLARVAERHQDVFASLAAFVAAGNELIIVPGNHDREFHWDRVREDLRAHLFRASTEALERRAEFFERIRFSCWFFWIEGVAYIEHGHQYDSFCATDHVITPVSPLDERRLSPGFTDVLLRFVVHRTAGIRQCDHDTMGVVDYIAFAAKLGFRGGLELFLHYLRAIFELFHLRRVALSNAARALCAEHDRRITHLANAMRIDVRRLRALVALQARPVTNSVRGIMASLLVDEIVVALLALAALTILGLVGFRSHAVLFAAWSAILGAWFAAHRYLSKTRQVDPQGALAARAGALGQLFPAAFVVMGHTHVPVRTAVGDGRTTYVNTGSWAEDASPRPDEPITHRAARTHLVIRVRDTGPEAELLTWSPAGPAPFGPAPSKSSPSTRSLHAALPAPRAA
jgi:UDP-2,3-diacylglucosamine pyrophosphatase LpxH